MLRLSEWGRQRADRAERRKWRGWLTSGFPKKHLAVSFRAVLEHNGYEIGQDTQDGDDHVLRYRLNKERV